MLIQPYDSFLTAFQYKQIPAPRKFSLLMQCQNERYARFRSNSTFQIKSLEFPIYFQYLNNKQKQCYKMGNHHLQ